MLTQYKNINQIQLASGSVSGERLSSSKTAFVSFDADEAVYFNNEINRQTETQRVELHVYADDVWITGNHRINLQSQIPEYRDSKTNAVITFPAQPLAINLYDEFNKMPKVRAFALTAADGSVDVGETINTLHLVLQSVNGVYSANGITGAVIDGTTDSQINFDAPVTADSIAIIFYS